MIAITGGIAEGKSTVAEMIRGEGFSVGSADAIATRVWQDSSVQQQASSALGINLPIDREALREAIANDPAQRHRLNRILHPAIVGRVLISQEDFMEVPLLVETCIGSRFSEIWVVTCGREEQRQRLIARYKNEDHAEKMMATQLPTRGKIPFATRVIRTNQAPDRVLSEVRSALANLRSQ